MISKSKENQLIRACKRCNLKKIQEIIKLANSPYVKNKRSKAASHEDLTHKYNSVRNRNVDINCRESKFQMTPLMITSLKGSREIVLFLIQNGANVSLKDIKGNTALQLACMKQRFHVVDALLQNKANPNDVNSVGWNCLISAVNYFHEDSASMLLLLLQTGAKSDHKDNSRLTSIDHAVKKNKINAIRVILNYNTKLAQSSIRALVNASIKGYFDIVLLLLNYGVNPNKVDIITGSGPLHEAVRYNDIKEEKVRQERIKIVHHLCLFGADPELVNVKRETPMNLALQKPGSISEQYLEAMKGYYIVPHKKPRFINLKANSLNELLTVPNFPLLKPLLNWTRNDLKFCSSYNPNIRTNLVTNLIDGNPQTMWTAPGPNLNWVTFDFKADHVITKIRIYCWKSKEMPSECFLQVSNSIEGPWNCVQSFRCEMIGSQYATSAGVGVDFDGFNAIARYWRVVITKNHGAMNTSFHGIEFFGYDIRITKLLNQLKLTEYENDLIENGLNQLDSLANCTYDIFESMPIENKNDKQKLWSFILEFQKRVQPLKKLDWFNEPVPFGLVGQNLPAFSATSTAYLTDTLNLICHGGGVIKGDTMIDMEPGGMNDPSMAIFRNIAFLNAGKFIMEIKSVKNNEISLSSQPIQIFNAGDPEYEKLASKMALNRNSKLTRLNLNDSDNDGDSEADDTLDQIYGFANFSERNSQMKINKWISKSQTDDENEDDFNQFRFKKLESPNYYGGSLDPNSRVSSAKHSNRYLKLSPRFNTISSDVNVQTEYETQSFTLDFNDDASLTSNHLLERVPSRNQPKNEARVYVNNPEIFVQPNLRQLNQVSPRNHSSPPSSRSLTNIVNNSSAYNKSNISVNSKDDKFYYHSDQKMSRDFNANNSYTTPSQENIFSKVVNVSQPYKSSVELSPSSNHSNLALSRKKSPVALSSPRTSKTSAPQPPHYSPKIAVADPTPPVTPQTSYPTPQPLSPRTSIKASKPLMLNSSDQSKIPPPPLLQLSSSIPVPPGPPPPPPPPPPPQFPSKTDGLLKFQKTSNNNESSKKMDSLQEELEKKLVGVRKSLAENSKSSALISLDTTNNIHRFDPSLVDSSLNGNNSNIDIQNSGSPNDDDKKTVEFELDPNETFTAKAKKALENYKNTKSSGSSISSQGNNSTSSYLKPNSKSNSKSKHAPLPFRSDHDEPKFVD